MILRKASSRGRRRLEKYTDERSASQSALHKMIELTDVRSLCRLPSDIKKYAVAICFKDDSSRLFSCDSGESERPSSLFRSPSAVDHRTGAADLARARAIYSPPVVCAHSRFGARH